MSRQEKIFEIIATAMLALTALATAWCGYQASLWDGNQASNYSRASSARVQASTLSVEADDYRLADATVFENYINAFLLGDTDLAEFYRLRFRPELEIGYNAWIALDPFNDPNTPRSPLAMEEYRLPQEEQAAAESARADALFAQGEQDNDTSDVYTLATLMFAAVLFFTAISERFEFVVARVVLLSMAAIGLLAGIFIAFDQPITWG